MTLVQKGPGANSPQNEDNIGNGTVQAPEEDQDVMVKETKPTENELGPKVTRERKSRKQRKRTVIGAERAVSSDVPMLTIETATPSPRPHSRTHLDSNNNEDGDEDNDGESDDDDMGEEEEEEEEEEKETEMTPEEKKAMYEAVKTGDIDALEDSLDKPNADINMTWENLLMTAIRAGHQEMAEFLLDNGVDHHFSTSIVAKKDTSHGVRLERFELSCRQMAYDHGFQDLVLLIDSLQGKLFPFISLPSRTPRLRRPKPPTPTQSDSEISSDDDDDDDDDADVSSSESEPTERMEKRMKKKKRKEKKNEEGKEGDKERSPSAFESRSEADSGNHSMASSKLKKSLLQEHDRLIEKDEIAESVSANSPRRDASVSGGGGGGGAGSGEKSHKSASDASEQSESRVKDEGYGSVSHHSEASPCVSPDTKQPWALLVQPTNRIQSNKSALAVRMANRMRHVKHWESPPRETPLHWRKVAAAGSYAKESPQWHANTTSLGAIQTCVEISELPCHPSACSSASTSSLASSVSRLSMAGSKDSRTASSLGASTETAKVVSSKRQVAGYMRPTVSTSTKRRLSPNFVSSYGGLDFTQASSRNQASGFSPTPADLQGSRVKKSQIPQVTNTRVQQRRNQQRFLSFCS